MTTVWKYPIEVKETNLIRMPKGAQVLYVAVQHDKPCIWARVDPTQRDEARYFWLVGTGHPNAEGEHVGSFMLQEGRFVFHLFEVQP